MAATASTPPESAPAPIALAPLAAALRTGDVDPHTLLDELAARFATREPEIRAFVPEPGRFDRLHHEAESLLVRHPDPAARPPLFGVPVAVKDIFHAGGFPTRAGSRLPPEALAGEEAAVVTALKAAGALILGKAVTTEFAFFAPGPTRNPHRPTHTPGGSSSGSAAAVAAGLAPLALGTQTIGSIGRPAAFCGIVGFKPTYDRISRAGVFPLSPSLDHVGLFTADAAGARLAAGALCSDWREGAGRLLSDGGGPRPVLGVPVGPYLERAGDEAREHFRAVRERLAAAGYEIREVPALADFAEVEARQWRILAAEVAKVHADLYRRYGDLYHAKTAELIRRGQAAGAEDLTADLAGRAWLRDELTARMDERGLDLWLSPPATGPAPVGLGATGDPVMNLPWTHAGLPTLVLPAGRSRDGLPMGIQLAGRFGADEELLAWGIELEGAVAP